MSGTKIFLILISVLGAFLVLAKKIMEFNFRENGDRSVNLILVFLLLISFLTIAGVTLSYNIQPTVKKIIPEKGERGNRGMRGNSGEGGKCGLKCNDNSCYRKILDHISNVYNIYCEINGLEKLKSGRHIENIYLKKKIKEMCNSSSFSNLQNLHGMHKLNLHGKNNTSKDKCDLNRDCGAYDYAFQKWTEWILIILKYKNGKMFLDSENMTDNNFNSMIDSEDIDDSLELNKKWIFDLGTTDCYKNETNSNCLSFIKILEPDDDKEVQKKIMSAFRKTDFYKFYSVYGVPDAFNESVRNLSTEKQKITKLRSPFEEIQEYDAWYWGAPEIAQPRVLNKCDATTDYKQINRPIDLDVDEDGKVKKNPKKIKIRFSNDYHHIWSNKKARQAKMNYIINSEVDKLSYVPNLQKGDKLVNIYRVKDFYDNSEKDTDFKMYKPLGDIIVPENDIYNKNENDENYPKYKQKINTRKSTNYLKNGPRLLNVLVSGPDLKPPKDFKLIYQSLRISGYRSGEEGYSVWRPIPPQGYVCLGDVFHISARGEKPNRNIIRCLPIECVEQISNVPQNYSFQTPNSVMDFNGSANVVVNGVGEIRDTDSIKYPNCKLYYNLNNQELLPKIIDNENSRNPDGTLKNKQVLDFQLSRLNLFRGSSGSSDSSIKFYKIKSEYIYDDSSFLTPRTDLSLVSKEKFSKDYSILKIYED